MVSIEILRNQGNNFLMLSLLKHSIHQGWYLKQQFFCTGQPECTILAHRVRTEVGYWLLDQHLLQFPLTLLEWMVNFWLLEKCSFTTKYFSCLLGDSELCQKFLKEKQWKIVKKYLVKSVSQRKCAPNLLLRSPQNMFWNPGAWAKLAFWTWAQAVTNLQNPLSSTNTNLFLFLFLQKRSLYLGHILS